MEKLTALCHALETVSNAALTAEVQTKVADAIALAILAECEFLARPVNKKCDLLDKIERNTRPQPKHQPDEVVRSSPPADEKAAEDIFPTGQRIYPDLGLPRLP